MLKNILGLEWTNMKWYGIVAIVFIFFALGGIVYAGANTDKLGFNFGESSHISREISSPSYSSEQLSTTQPKKYSTDCNYWDGQWELLKFQRDQYDYEDASYLRYELEMEKLWDKFKEACYGQK